MIRVGFIHSRTDDNWLGGLNYLKNLLLAIRSVPDARIEPVLITSPVAAGRLAEECPGVTMLLTNLVDRRTLPGFTAKAAGKLLGTNYLLEAFLRRHNIAILSHSARPGERSKFPNLSWIPDFQHKRRPDFFDAGEIAERDRNQTKAIESSTLVILSSYDAQNDMRHYFPGGAEKSAVLHFVSGLSPEPSKLAARAGLEAAYGFSGPYFHLPNQFWKHKNHTLVLDALAALKAQGRSVTVISTGKPMDYRHPEYFDGFKAALAGQGMQAQFKILGVVPLGHVMSLMYHSIAVINPSFFEGWSSTVEESKSMGKSVLLSDIPVHREQAPARGSFFSPEHPQELAALLASHAQAYDRQREESLARAAMAENARKFVDFGRAYEAIVLQAMEPRRATP